MGSTSSRNTNQSRQIDISNQQPQINSVKQPRIPHSVSLSQDSQQVKSEVTRRQLHESNIYKQFKKDTLVISKELQANIENCNKILKSYNKPNYLKQIFGHCSMETPIVINSSQIYIGQWSQGTQCGFGQLIDQSNLYYIGYFFKNKYHGHGRIIYEDGDYYEGEWANGVPCGSGIFYNKFGGVIRKLTSRTIKQFKNQPPTYLDNEQRSYYGRFENGQRIGDGLYYWADGTYYLGEFEKDMFSGNGIMIYANGNSYKGEFRKGEFDGVGLYEWADGKYYYGNYRNGIKEGFGIQFNGRGKYEGYFRDGKMQGKGVYTEVITNKKTYGYWDCGKILTNEEAQQRGFIFE